MLHKRTIHTFYDLLSTHSTLNKIENLFECESIFQNEFYESSLTGDRRSLADNYVSSLDLTNASELRKILNVIEMFLLENEDNEFIQEDSRWKQLFKLLERDGFTFANGKLLSVNTIYIPKEIEEITSEFNIEHVKKDWERALDQAKADPEDAITATRAMLESTLKWILDDIGEEYDKKENLSQLYRRVAKQLNLSPDQHGEEIFKQILGSINGVVTGLGSLRNEYGDSHGKGKVYYKPSQRHAKFAINLSGTVCMYLLETYFANEKSISV
ncbi:abortive infection family protein [Aquibacillus kalidii]|uniref:abortive infection family protein n=1 Tax=Aquibacillus kalidii TaxID=2762597 RepID=UPI001644524F|nr:abortive infection family protein [Aquibacillus kalidii]